MCFSPLPPMGPGSPEMTSACMELQSAGVILGEGRVSQPAGTDSEKWEEGRKYKSQHLEFSVNCRWEAFWSWEKNLITCKSRTARNKTGPSYITTPPDWAKSSPDRVFRLQPTVWMWAWKSILRCPNKDKINYYSLHSSNKYVLHPWLEGRNKSEE